VHPDDLAGGFSDLEMTWLLYCAGAATAYLPLWAELCFLCIHAIKISIEDYSQIKLRTVQSSPQISQYI